MTHKDLEVYKNSRKRIIEVYSITNRFPTTELFGLVSQIRRASVSVAVNIGEGAARGTASEFIRFLRISSGSLAELDSLVEISGDLVFLDQFTVQTLKEKIRQVNRQLSGLIKSLNQKKNRSIP